MKAFYADKRVDFSPLRFIEDDPGVMDYVVIAGLVRSPMGRFQTLFSSGKRWWSVPREADIIGCKVAAIDPFFGKESLQAMEICRKHGIPYVTIDSPHDSPLHQHAAVNVVSKECTGQYYADIKPEAVMERLMETAEGLTILTQGGGDMLYGRKDAALHRMKPFDVEVRSTLGAGDTFKAGCVYGLLHGMADDALVRFASVCSAIAISRFPLPLHPPKLDGNWTYWRELQWKIDAGGPHQRRDRGGSRHRQGLPEDGEVRSGSQAAVPEEAGRRCQRRQYHLCDFGIGSA